MLTDSIEKAKKKTKISRNSAQTQQEPLITLTRFVSPCVTASVMLAENKEVKIKVTLKIKRLFPNESYRTHCLSGQGPMLNSVETEMRSSRYELL